MISYSLGEILVICGKAGKGKSHFAKFLASRLNNIVIWDVHAQHKDLGIPISNINQIKAGKWVYVPEDYSLGHFDLFCGKCYDVWNTTIFVEEAQSYLPSSPFPLKNNIGRLISQGRNRGIGLVCITRRIADLHKDIVSQSKIVSFYQFWDRDIETLEANIPRLDGEIVKKLKDYEFLYFDGYSFSIFEPV